MKILAFTPTFGDGPRPETLASVQAQVCAGQLVHEVSWHNPFPAPDMRNVLAQFVRGRQMALDGGFDALLTVEHDMRLPTNAAQMLWDADAPVAYGVYLFRQCRDVLNAWAYLGPGSRNLGESLSLPRNRSKLNRALRRGGPVEVSGCGHGCTLIRRAVLEQIPFRTGEKGTEAPDVPFATDCLRANVRQVAHFGVLCGHWDGERWLAPLGADDMGDTVLVRANKNVYIRVGGGTKELIAGSEYDLQTHAVKDLVRAGYVTPLAVDPLPAEAPLVERAVKPKRETAVGRGQGSGG